MSALAAQEAPTQMAQKRRIEVFSAGCSVCDDGIALVERLACDSCEVIVRDMRDPEVVAQAYRLGVQSVPAVAIDGRLADCGAGRGLDEAALRSAGLGQPL